MRINDNFDEKINPKNKDLEEKKEKEVLERHPNVDLYLSTVDELIGSEPYDFGRFITRILRRFNLIDDFWMDGIACCQYNPQIRRISIKINPIMLWKLVLRKVVLDNNINVFEINSIDRELKCAFEEGGWQKQRFDVWIEFLKSKNVVNYNNKNSSSSTCLMSIIVHEVMHVIWSHLSKERKSENHKIANIAQDFAINQTLDFCCFNNMFMTTKNNDLLFSFYMGGAPLINCEDRKEQLKLEKKYEEIVEAVEKLDYYTYNNLIKDVSIDDFKEKFLNQPFEYYYNLLIHKNEMIKKVLSKSNLNTNGENEDGDMYDFFQHVLGQEFDGEVDGYSEMSEEEKKEKIKNALGLGQSNTGISVFEGFNPATTEMKKVIGNDLKRTVDDMIAKGEIQSPSDLERERPFNLNKAFVKAIENLYKTDTKDWDRLLKNQIMKCVGMKIYDYTMKREARGAPDMFPGKSRLKSFDLIIVIDVSGSINHDDYNRFVNEIEKIAKQVSHPYVRVIQFHSEVSLDIRIPLKKITDVGIPETGGTVLQKPLNMLENERNKTMVVVFTDGWVENEIKNIYNFPSVIFVSASGNGEICKSLTDRGWKVIHQDSDNDWWD